MKFKQIIGFSYGAASVEFNSDKQKVAFDLSEAENAEVIAICWRAFERQQAVFAREITDAKPPALPAPDCVDGEYTPVDDKPF
jgi:hypothetical protein